MMRRARVGDLERFAKSIARSFAVGSLGFCGGLKLLN